MKYYSTLPLTAILTLVMLTLLVQFNVIPPGLAMLSDFKSLAGEYFFTLILVIILLESIVYVGFYFPGQFFAVVLVVGANPNPSDIVKLTLAMVVGATLGSCINYEIGKRTAWQPNSQGPMTIRSLLIAMIHINSLAFFMVTQGAMQRGRKVIALAGILNLPYYLLLIFGTAMLSEEIMQLAEKTIPFLLIAVSIWLAIALFLDYRRGAFRSSTNE